jgi:hypothetical protein
MADLKRSPSTDATVLYRYRDEIYAADMMIAALKGLDLFAWLEARPATIDDIAGYALVDISALRPSAVGTRDGRPKPATRNHPSSSTTE